MAEEAVGTEPVGSAAPAEGTPPAGLAPEGTGTEGESGASEEPTKYVVKVGGKAQEVTLEEALNGYQRQADYTRKSQELAAERQRLAQAEQVYRAIETNPAEAIPALARLLGVDLGTPQGQAAVAAALDPSDPVSLLTSKVDQMLTVQQQRDIAEQQRVAQAQQVSVVQAQIERDLQDLAVEYGEFDRTALMQFAVNAEIPNLRSAMKAFQWEQAEDTRIQERNRAIEAKRTAQVVEGGRSPQAGANSSSERKFTSVREAFLAAVRS